MSKDTEIVEFSNDISHTYMVKRRFLVVCKKDHPAGFFKKGKVYHDLEDLNDSVVYPFFVKSENSEYSYWFSTVYFKEYFVIFC
jgi:hypothetical protein